MTHHYVLAIDNGSQSTKVQVIDAYGAVHASAQRRLRPYEHPVAGHVVHPGDDLWESIVATCREAVAAFPGDSSEIQGIGLCTIRFCRALLDEAGELVEPVLSWMDERVDRPYRPTPGVHYVTTSSGYLTARLTGQRRDAAANYQGLWPIDQRTIRWSDDPADYTRTGLPRELLFDVVDPGEVLGGLTAEAASAIGLPAGTPVYATANDKAVEALGSGVLDGGTMLVSLGTYIAAMTPGDSPRGASPSYWANFSAVPGRYLFESNGIRRGMWTVSWARDVLMPAEPTRPLGVAERELDLAAGGVPPGCHGLMTVLDWLAPTDATYRRGAMVGFNGSQAAPEIYRSVLEGIALTMSDHIETLEAALGRWSDRLVVAGGGSKSDTLMQILADCLDRPVERSATADPAGLGAAICAMVGSGTHASWDEARRAMVGRGPTFTPTTAGARAYGAIRSQYRRLLAGMDAVTAAVYDRT